MNEQDFVITVNVAVIVLSVVFLVQIFVHNSMERKLLKLTERFLDVLQGEQRIIIQTPATATKSQVLMEEVKDYVTPTKPWPRCKCSCTTDVIVLSCDINGEGTPVYRLMCPVCKGTWTSGEPTG